MKIKNIFLLSFLSLLPIFASCKKDAVEDDPTYGILYIDNDKYSVDALASKLEIDVTSDCGWKVEILEATSEWIDGFTQTGSEDGTIIISFSMNPEYQNRTAYFRLSAEEGVECDPIQFELTQEKRSEPISVAEVLKMDLHKTVYLEDLLVLGTFENGFLAKDETGLIVVEQMNPAVAKGDQVSISGHSARYHSVNQIDAIKVIVTSSGHEIILPETPELKMDSKLVKYMSSDTVEYVNALVSVVSSISLKGREEYSIPAKSTFVSTDVGARLDTLSGKSARVEGYIYGSRDGKAYLYVFSAVEYIEPSYFSIDKSTFKDVAYNGAELSFKVSSNVDWTITHTNGLTVSPTFGTGSATVSIKVEKNETDQVINHTVSVSTTADVEKKQYDITFKQIAAPSHPDPVHLKLNLLRSESTWPFESPKLSDVPSSDSSIGSMKGDVTYTLNKANGSYVFVFHCTDGMKCNDSQGLGFGKQAGNKLDLPVINKLKLVKVCLTFGVKNNSCSYIADSKGTIVKGGEATAKGIAAGTTYTWTLSDTVESAGYSIVLNPSLPGMMYITALELFYE